MATFGSLVAISGMFAGYVGLYHLTKRSLFSIEINKAIVGKELIRGYKNLRILTILTNDCFQKVVALPLKILMMSTCVLTGIILWESKLRRTTSPLELYLCLYIITNLYIFIIIAYSLPGQANYNSRIIVQKSKQWLTTICLQNRIQSVVSRIRLKTLQKVMTSCGEIRIRFAGFNFYERQTWIILVEFMLEFTINLVLMI